jgi:hypothetical protein
VVVSVPYSVGAGRSGGCWIGRVAPSREEQGSKGHGCCGTGLSSVAVTSYARTVPVQYSNRQ